MLFTAKFCIFQKLVKVYGQVLENQARVAAVFKVVCVMDRSEVVVRKYAPPKPLVASVQRIALTKKLNHVVPIGVLAQLD